MDHDLAGNLLHMTGLPNSAIAHFAMVFTMEFQIFGCCRQLHMCANF